MTDVDLAPLSGSPAGVGALAQHSRRAATALDEACSGVRRVVATLAAERSAAVRSAQHRLDDVVHRLTTCADVLGTAATALDRHAEALSREQGEALRALARRDEALARVRHHQLELDAACSPFGGLGTAGLGTAGLGTAGLGTAAGAGSWEALAAERRLRSAQADVLAAETDWRRARDAKQAASSRTAAVLRGLGDVRALRTAVAAGTDVNSFRDSWVQGQHAAETLDAAASGGTAAGGTAAGGTAAGAADRVEQAREALRDLLTEHADDPAFWTAFWDSATPQELYLALGPGVGIAAAPPDAELRAALTGGVEAWAQTASPAELVRFGSGVVDGVGDWPTGLAPRAELAAALLPPTLPATVYGPAFDALGQRPADDGGVDLDATAPLWIAVAAGLARFPRLALDRFSPADPTRTAAVSRRWFGTLPGARLTGGRGIAWPDGGTAVARAFRAAVEAGSSSLGVVSRHERPSSSPPRPPTCPTVCSPGPSPTTRTCTSPAPTTRTSRRSRRRRSNLQGTTDDVLLSSRGTRPTPAVQPELDSFALREVIAATSRTTVGADAWLSGGDRLGQQVTDLATTGGLDADTALRNDLGYHYLQDVGVIAGATQAQTVSDAHQRAENRDLVIGLVGFATVKSPELVANTVGAVSAALPTILGDPVPPARERVLATEPELRRQFAAPLHDAVVAHDVALGLNPDQAESRSAPLDPDDDVVCDTFRGTYTDTSDVRPEHGERDCGTP